MARLGTRLALQSRGMGAKPGLAVLPGCPQASSVGAIPLSLIPHCRLLSALGCRGQIKGDGAGTPYEEHPGSSESSQSQLLPPPSAQDPAFLLGTVRGDSLHYPGQGRAGPGLRCYTSLAPALGAQAEPDVLGWGHLALNLILFCKAPGRGGLTFLPHG